MIEPRAFYVQGKSHIPALPKLSCILLKISEFSVGVGNAYFCGSFILINDGISLILMRYSYIMQL